ncbi:MAG TPA: hypothetical protein VED46_09965 [Alphaproteobacteria bacterium]|jgi:hypothetical protein|nr:hypothetical protein [Alphaproteobacteria bacterium]
MKRLEFGDMVFYAITGLILILLFWLRFLEESLGLWGAWLLWLGWSFLLIGLYLNGHKGRGTAARRAGGRTGMQHDKGGMANGPDQS